MDETLTVQQVERLLEQHFDRTGGGWYGFSSARIKRDGLNVAGLDHVEVVEFTSHDEYNIQLQVVLDIGGRQFVKQGVWVSHDGAYWDGDFFEARQVEKVVKVWEQIGS